MKIGSFYGFSAPMILLLLEDAGEVQFQKFVSQLDNNVDRENLVNAKKELYFFEKALSQIPCIYESDYDAPNLDGYDAYIQIDHGSVNNYDGDADDLYVSIKQSFLYNVVSILLEPRNLNCLNTEAFTKPITQDSLRSDLMRVINETINTSSFILADVTKMSKRISRSFIVRGNEADEATKNDFIQAATSIFNLKCSYATEFNTSLGKVTLSDDAYKIMTYFLGKKELIKKCQELIKIKEIQENVIFTVPFQDLIYRKPESLMSEVVRLFKTVTTTQKKQFLLSVRDNAIAQIELFAKLFREKVSKRNSVNNLTGLTLARALEVANAQYPDSKLKSQISSGVIDGSNLNEETWKHLLELELYADNMNLFGLNQRFHTNMNTSDFAEALDQLNKIGLCGLNLFTTSLFLQSMSDLSLNMFTFIIMDDESIEKFEYVVHEITALLETMRPIGGSVNEKLINL